VHVTPPDPPGDSEAGATEQLAPIDIAVADVVDWGDLCVDGGVCIECVEGRLDEGLEIDVVAGGVELCVPGGFDFADIVECLADEGLSFWGEADESGSPVSGVGLAFEVSGVFECLDEFAHRLVGHAAALGEGGESGAVAVDVLEHGLVGCRDVGVAGGVQAGNEVVDHQLGALAHERQAGDDARRRWRDG
jgi:hypothetical protein